MTDYPSEIPKGLTRRQFNRTAGWAGVATIVGCGGSIGCSDGHVEPSDAGRPDGERGDCAGAYGCGPYGVGAYGG